MKNNKPKVTYSVVQHKNPHKAESASLYYAQAQARDEMDFDAICNEIQSQCTVTKADITGVMVALESVMSRALADGKIVRLGDFGTFKVSVSSNGAPSREAFNESYIRGTRYLFHPGLTLKDVQKKMKFEQVERKVKADEVK